MVSAPTSEFHFGSTVFNLRGRTHLMGILNVTPDSFSDGGEYFSGDAAVSRGLRMIDEGADCIDIGGESTRPGADPVATEEEIRRVIPVIRELAKLTRVPLSIDTTKSEVAERALDAGAVIVNDISGLRADPALAEVAARYRATLVIMHSKGTPRTMQQDPSYDDVIGEISAYLQNAIILAERAGVGQIIVDPGIGFGKDLRHNLEILRRLRELQSLDHPVLVGPSRKSFIGKLLDLPVAQRIEGTSAAVAIAIMNGANIIRVHDVREMKRVATVVDAVMHTTY